MRQYELTAIVGTENDETELGKKGIDDTIKKVQAQVIREEDSGIRDLAYEVKKRDKGHYYYWELELEPQQVQLLDEELRLLNPVLKHLLIKKEE
jgi:small subunit ribosomal protein S6